MNGAAGEVIKEEQSQEDEMTGSQSSNYESEHSS
jgi:hypothetical protein